MTSIHRLPLCAALCTAAVAAASAASAQPYELSDGVTVYGHASPYGDNDTLSQTVSYADLDLTSKDGVDELRWRVARAAEDVCDQLNEDPAHDAPLLPSCRAAARDSASRQIDRAIDDARYARFAANRYQTYRDQERATAAEADRYYKDRYNDRYYDEDR
jgi:UrcA family protein